jgi:hypothetical protein
LDTSRSVIRAEGCESFSLVTVSGSLSFFLGYLPKSIKIIDAAAFICASAYMLYSIGSYRVELEADAVASSLIGVDAVERGATTKCDLMRSAPSKETKPS